MRNEENEGLRPLTNKFKLEIGQNWGSKKGLDRESRKWCLSEKTNRVDPYIFIETSISTDRAGIKEVWRIKAQCIESCRGVLNKQKV